MQTLKERREWDAISQSVAEWERGPMYWFTEFTKTEDSHALAKGTPFRAPFPKKEMYRIVTAYFLTEETLLVPKSREVGASWLFCCARCLASNLSITRSGYCKSGKESKSEELINYCRILYSNQDGFLQKRNLLTTDNSLELRFQNGGRVLGVAAGQEQVRTFHPFGVLFDEAAFIAEFAESFDAVRPVAKQVIALSTDEMGAFHNLCKLEEDMPTGGIDTKFI
jgi:hypothetical protein